MLSEGFLKFLARKNVAPNVASVGMSGGDAVKPSMVVDSSENVVQKTSVKEKERKRHRDGSSSCHHHKKNKDASKAIVLKDTETAVKKGAEPQGVEVSKLDEGITPENLR